MDQVQSAGDLRTKEARNPQPAGKGKHPLKCLTCRLSGKQKCVFSNIEADCERCVNRGLDCGVKRLAKADLPARKLQIENKTFHEKLTKMGDRWRSSRKKNVKEILHIFDPDQKPPINNILQFFGYGPATSLMTDTATASQLSLATGPSLSRSIYPGNTHNGTPHSTSDHEDLGDASGADARTPTGPVQLFPTATNGMWNPVTLEFDSDDYLNYITEPDYPLLGSAAVLVPHGSNSSSAPTALSAMDISPPNDYAEHFGEDDWIGMLNLESDESWP